MLDSLGDRMKFYEHSTMDSSLLLPKIPIIARLDGVAFHSYTKGLKRPYDEALSNAMIKTTKYLAESSNALIGYTQSDEISLMWLVDGFENQMWFNGKVQKLISILSSLCSVKFNSLREDYTERIGVFDCRVWNVPTKEEAYNYFLWRERDASKNSITMAASVYYSHKELHGKHSNEKQELLFQKGINWNDYPAFFKRGSFIKKIVTQKKFSTEELSKLPLKHEARLNPDLLVNRSEYKIMNWPRISTMDNAVDLLFKKDLNVVA